MREYVTTQYLNEYDSACPHCHQMHEDTQVDCIYHSEGFETWTYRCGNCDTVWVGELVDDEYVHIYIERIPS